MSTTVIGAQGFVGERLASVLEHHGQAVWRPRKGDPDLLTRDLGVVYYCAGLTADFDRRPFDTVDAHVSLLTDVLRIGRFDRLVYLSSTRLYDGLAVDDAREDQVLNFDPADPRRTYDLSKALGENLTLTRSGGRGAVARLANVFDWVAEAPGFLSQWLIAARTSRDLELASSPHVARDYIHLDDVVAGLIAMTSAVAPGVVNLSSGERVTNGQIAQVFEAAGWRIKFTGDASPSAPPNADNGKLVELGVRPTQVRQVVERYLAEANAP